MEYIPGVTLLQWTENHKDAPLRARLGLLLQAGKGLAAAHAAGITHRDFKPANAIVGEDGRVRVLDFGLARARAGPDTPFRLAEEPVSQEITFGSGAGTPAYMAPEQTEAGEVGPPADQFAFCVVAWAVLTGSRPFPSDKDQRLDAILSRTMKGGDVALPRRIRNALIRGLSYEAGDRFPDMNALLRELASDRRRLVIAGVTGAWLLGGVAFAAGTWGDSEAPCDGDDELQTAWHDGARDRVTGAITEAKAPFAAATAQRVREEVDAWVEDWSEVYSSSCKAAKRRGDLPLDRYEVIYACLDERRRQMFRRLELLETPDAAAVRNALRVVRGVEPPRRCTDPRVIATREANAPAKDAEAQALFEAIDAEAAQLTAGRIQGRVEALEPLVARADELGNRRLRALAIGQRGRARRWGGAHEPAQDDYEAAFNLALAAGDLELASPLANAFAYGEHYEGDIDGALQWLRLARTTAGDDPSDRLQRSNDIAEAEFLLDAGRAEEALVFATRAAGPTITVERPDYPRILARQIVGRVLHKLGRMDEAVEHGTQALEQCERLFGQHHPFYAQALRFVGVFTLDADRPAAALDLLTEADDIDRRAGNNDAPGQVQLHGANIAEALLRLGRYEEAVAKLEDTDRLLAGETVPATQLVAYARWVRGRALHGVGRLKEAEADLRQAHALTLEAGAHAKAQEVWYAHSLAQVLIEAGKLDEAAKMLATVVDKIEPDERPFHDLLQAMLAAARGEGDDVAAAWERAHATGKHTHLVRQAKPGP